MGITLDFKINVTPAPSCTSPNTLIVNDIRPDSAELTWVDTTNGNASYIVEWREASTTNWNSDTTTAGATSYSLTGLTPQTEYEWKITADCGGGDTSNTITANNFTTLDACPSPSNLVVNNVTFDSADLSWTRSFIFGFTGSYIVRMERSRNYNLDFLYNWCRS